MPASTAWNSTLPRPTNPAGGGIYRQPGRMPRDAVVLPAAEIPPDCLCSWVASGSAEIKPGEMVLKFVNARCAHAAGSVPWDYGTSPVAQEIAPERDRPWPEMFPRDEIRL